MTKLCLGKRSFLKASDEILVLLQWMDSWAGLRKRIPVISVAEQLPYEVNGIGLQVDRVHSASLKSTLGTCA